jgi:hypothetical protein
MDDGNKLHLDGAFDGLASGRNCILALLGSLGKLRLLATDTII